jgi:hypothetical protein
VIILVCSTDVKCVLCDKSGNIVDPGTPGTVSYRVISQRTVREDNLPETEIFVQLTGHIRLISQYFSSPPIPFRVSGFFNLLTPRGSDIHYALKAFRCKAKIKQRRYRVDLSIDSLSWSSAPADLVVPAQSLSSETFPSKPGPFQATCLRVERVFDMICFRAKAVVSVETCLLYARVYQYSALARDGQWVFTDGDELTQYGNRGILDPQQVSFQQLFINGVLQPPINYILEKGKLTLTTQDSPLTGAPVILRYFTLTDSNGAVIKAETAQYLALAQGGKREYTDADKLLNYNSSDILNPRAVSYINLYINGALQPPVNYTVERGKLTLNTADLPPPGAPIILEFVKIGSPRPLPVKINLFNAAAKARKIYTDADAIEEYKSSKLIEPSLSSCQNLYINAVVQPRANYRLSKGALRLLTSDLPLENSPITVQYLRICENLTPLPSIPIKKFPKSFRAPRSE